MRLYISAAAFVIAAGVLAAPASAQAPPARTGFWIGLGAGWGWTRVSCEICKADRSTAPALQLRLGGTLSRHLLLGAESAGWMRAENGVDELLGTAGAAVYWYPNPSRPLYLTGGLGIVAYRAADEENTLTSTALGPKLGLGYEFRIGRNVSLAPFVNLTVASLEGDLKFNGATVADPVSLTFVQFGAAVVRH